AVVLLFPMRIRPKAKPLDWVRYKLFASRPTLCGGSVARKPLAIFKAERLGDFLLAQPAIQRLIELHGAANCTLIVSHACRAIADRFFPEVEKVEVALEFSCGDWNWFEARRQAEAFSRFHFEKAVCLTHHRKPALWSAWTAIRADKKIGLVEHPWMLPSERKVERGHLDVHAPYPRQVSPDGGTCLELEAHAVVLNACGCGPVSASELRPRLKCSLPRPVAKKPVLGIVPGGSSRLKLLPDELMGMICGQLADSRAFDVWLIGDATQRGALERFRAHLAKMPKMGDVRICCEWDLKQLEAGLMHCAAVLSADTFTAHLATALDLPVAVLAAGGQPDVFGPWRNSGHQRWFTHEMDCFGCGWRCVHKTVLCVERIDPCAVSAFLADVFAGL
ncbi:MAG: glycosyltransferase family 9 protein, partial [Verrucomicrobiia bacterium]